MKKGITYAALSAMALSTAAVAPVAASAAEATAPAGIYDTVANKHYTFPEFSKLTKTEKVDLLKKNGVVIVYNDRVLTLLDVVSVTNAELPTAGKTTAEYKTATGTDLVAIATPPVATGLEVESVSAINANSVTVTFPALTADILGATVEVKDSKGNVVEVDSVDLSAGETTADFAFKEAVAEADLVGTWTVDGVSYNLSLVTQLTTFEETTSQIELYELLVELGIQNLDSANAAAYSSEKSDFLDDLAANDKELTVEAIQTFVNDVNASQVSADEQEAAVKAVVDSLGNNVALKSALAHPAFTKVNNEWIEDLATIDGYATELTTVAAVPANLDSVAEIQAVIDAVNEAVIAAEILTVVPSASVDKAEMATLKTLIETYAPVDADGEYVTAANQTALDNIAEQSAVADVLAATTASNFKSKVTALAGLVNTSSSTVIDLEDYVDANGKAYIDVIKDLNATTPTLTAGDYGVTGKVNTTAEIVSLIAAVNTDVEEASSVKLFTDLETAINGLAATPTATQKSKYVAALTALGIEQVSTSSDNVTEYLADKAAIKTASQTVTDSAAATPTPVPGNATTAKATIQGLIDGGNIAVVKAADDAGIIAALNVLELKNVVAANAVQYAVSAADTTTVGAIGTAAVDTAGEIQTAINAINKQVSIDAAVKAINDATTATQVKTALDTLADEGEVSGYLNVTSADRVFVAEQVLAARDELKAYADDTTRDTDAVAKKFFDATEVGTAVTAATSARTTAIASVNALTDDPTTTTLTVVAEALILVGHDSITGSYDADTTTYTITANDTEIAEKFYSNLTFDETSHTVSPKYTSISAIRAAITAAQ